MKKFRESIGSAVRKSFVALGGVASYIGQQITLPALPSNLDTIAYQEGDTQQENDKTTEKKDQSLNDTVVICPSVCDECASENQVISNAEFNEEKKEVESNSEIEKDCILVAVNPSSSKRHKIS